MSASSLGLLPALPLTPRCHRQDDGQLSPIYPPSPNFSLFGAACVKLCRLIPPSLVRNARLCCLVCLKRRGYEDRFALNMKTKSSIIFYSSRQWMRSQRRSQFEHDHRRRADRAPQITASHTRDRRRAHWHICIEREAWTGPNRCRMLV